MKILFDYQTFQLQKFGGISRYFFELFNHFNADSDLEWTLPLLYSNNEYLKLLNEFNNIIPLPEITRPNIKPNYYKKFMWGLHFKGKWQLYSLKKFFFPEPAFKPSVDLREYNRQLTIEKLKEGNFDIFHPTYYDSYFLKYLGNKPFVLTVYDMIHELFPEYFIHSQTADDKKILIEKATKIIAISESTKRDIIQLYDIPEERIIVTYLGNSMQDIKSATEMQLSDIPGKYLLYVGHREIYKNFYFFIYAIFPLLKEDKHLYIICTGPSFNDSELAFFYKLGISDQIKYYYVKESNFPLIYSQATALIYPSLYEGFGIPILEAFHCNCPVICSNTSSIPEVGGDAVKYFEPKNTLSIRNAIKEVIYNNECRNRLIYLGEQQLKKFSWKKTAEKTKNIYQNILN